MDALGGGLGGPIGGNVAERGPVIRPARKRRASHRALPCEDTQVVLHNSVTEEESQGARVYPILGCPSSQRLQPIAR
jgi:hypothetical protein